MAIWKIAVLCDGDNLTRTILVEADTQVEAEKIALDNYYYPIGRAARARNSDINGKYVLLR